MKIKKHSVKATYQRVKGFGCRQVLVLSLCLLMPGVSLMAEEVADIVGSRDSVYFKRYQHSYIVEYQQGDTDNYQLVTGSIEEVNGEKRAGRKERLEGDLSRFTYRIPDGHSPLMALDNVVNQLEAAQAELLFACNKRDCGNSNLWANWVFGVKELYGPDRKQHYRVYRLQRNERVVYFALYAIERGNKRVYLHVDQLEKEQARVVASVLSRLIGGQKVVFPAVLQSVSAEDVQQIREYLNGSPERRLYVVGHRYGRQSLDSLKKASREQAEEFVKLLDPQAAFSRRLIVEGLGPLAPTESVQSGTDRLELIPY